MQIPEQIKSIYEQVGGARAMAMAFSGWSYSSSEVAVTFSVAPALRRSVREGITHVRVTLLPEDTYRVEFLHVSRAWSCGRPVFALAGVYARDLRPLIERRTGIQLSLGSLGAAVAR